MPSTLTHHHTVKQSRKTFSGRYSAYKSQVARNKSPDINQNYKLVNKLTTDSSSTELQDISYTFDKVGNITNKYTDDSTQLSGNTSYTYDDLDRLLTATTTNAASGDNYTRTYSYDSIGNITSKLSVDSGQSPEDIDYTYSESNYASPHAVTQAGDQNFTYDNNGNLQTDGAWTHSWDYKDRLISSSTSGTTVSYEYDEAKTRVIKHNESTGKITQYINDFFDIEDGEEKLYFYSGDLKLATLDLSSSAPTGDPDECDVPTSGNWTVNSDCTIATFKTAPADVTITAGTILTIASSGILEVDLNTNSLTVENGGGILIENGGSLAQVGVLSPLPGGTQGGVELVFHHSDHLSGASVDTDESGSVVALNDYYPFGDTRIESGEYENDYTYTGKERDEDTELLYYEARYYDSGIGRFISIDPWSGDITDPQSLNKYAYVRNNPLKYVDPEGEAYVSSFFQGQLTNFLNVLSLGFNNQKQQAQIASNRAKWQTLSAGGRVAGFSVTSTLLEHSLQDDPSDLIFTNGSDIANKVQQSSEYNDFVDQSISIATQEGKTSFTDTVTEESITFNSGDLFLAVHGTHSTTISGNLNDDGTWSVQTNIHDVYDFKQAQTYAENQSIESSAAWTLNNEAYKDQESGAINNYNININITEKRKRKQTNSGSNSNK